MKNLLQMIHRKFQGVLRQVFKSTLSDAIKHRDMAALKKLVDQGLDVNKPDVYGWSPAMIATHRGDAAGLDCIIKAGGDMNAKGSDLKLKNVRPLRV